MTGPAPIALHTWVSRMPRAPGPSTATDSPARTPMRLTIVCTEPATGSISTAALSLIDAGSTCSCHSGQTVNLANPPPVTKWARPSIGGSVLQMLKRPSRQAGQRPQYMVTISCTTRSPGLTRVTAGPTAFTTLTISWPATTEREVVFTPVLSAFHLWMSLPQMPQYTTSQSTSCGA